MGRRRLALPDRRKEILTAALEVFAQYGRDGARLQQIADRAGITESYLYKIFPSKDDLYEAAVEQPIIRPVERFEERIEAIRAEGEMSSATLILRINETILEFMIDAAPYFGVSIFSGDETAREGGTRIYRRVYEPVTSLLGRIKGWPNPTVSLELVAKSMWGASYGVVLDSILTEVDFDFAKTAERIAGLYTGGIPVVTRPD